MRTAFRATLLWLGVCLSAVAARAQDGDGYGEDLDIAARYFQKGELARARNVWDEILADHEAMGDSADGPSAATVLASRRGIAAVDLRRGEYDAAFDAFTAARPDSARDGAFVAIAVAALESRGRYEDAEELLRAYLVAAPADVCARVELADLLAETGRETEARELWQAVVSDPPAEAQALTCAARASLGLGGRAAVERASSWLVRAIELDPDLPEPRVLYGRLRFEVYGEWSGQRSGESVLEEVLRRNGDHVDALVELYRIRRTNHLLDPAKTESYLERALLANPKSVPALLERAIGLADDRRLEDAAAALDAALAINPNDKRVLAQRSALALLRGEPEAAERFRARAEAIDPDYPGVDLATGDRMVALYRFRDSVPFYRAALAAEPESVPALHGLAKALIYSGAGEEAAELLERAASLQSGYVNPWRNNALAVQRLLEAEYRTIRTGGFVFWLHRDDAAVLERYLVPYHLEARETLGEKYGYVPEEDVRVEVFHTWDDFSVRTIGFRGFTALGACFGPMITLVSPVDLDLRRNDFMWEATVWHEYTHVLTLALSRHRVPRWLTEGFSVYEEGQRDAAWERGMVRDLFDAYHNRDIPPLHLMNRLFRGSRILFGYYQGGLVVEYLTAQYGFERVVAMLDAYGRDLSTEEVFTETFGLDTREFDRRFLAWVASEKLRGLKLVPHWDDRAIDRFRAEARARGDAIDAHVALAWAFLQRGIDVDAAAHLREILRLDPEHAEGQLIRAELLRRRGDLDAAVAAYEAGFARGADDFDSRIRYGQTLVRRGDTEAAIRQFQAAKACWPQCTDQHVAPELMLARLYVDDGRKTEAMLELSTFCARTARAYEPRLQLAEHARQSGDRAQEAKLLEEAIAIDPFHRQVHILLAQAYEALGRKQLAVRELEMAHAVPPSLDRTWAGKPPAEVPSTDAPEFREEQATLCVRIGELLRELGRESAAREWFERALSESPDGDAADDARAALDR